MPVSKRVVRWMLSAAVLATPVWADVPTTGPATMPSTAPSTRSSIAPSTMASTMPVMVDPALAAIRAEGLEHSQVMSTLDTLCNVIGPRLTGSANLRRANDWTRQQLADWGMQNAHLEAWGPFGKGWAVERYSLQMIDPVHSSLISYPKAWCTSLPGPIEASVVHLDARDEAGLEKYKGQLAGKIVLIGPTREVDARFEPLASRVTPQELERLSTYTPRDQARPGTPRAEPASERRARFQESGARGERLTGSSTTQPTTNPADAPTTTEVDRATTAPIEATTAPTTGPSTGPTSGPSGRRRGGRGPDPFASRALGFATREGAALIITPSSQGDGGTFYVQSANLPVNRPLPSGPSTEPTSGPTSRPAGPRVWAIDAPPAPPQVTMAIEDYNRLARMLAKGQTPRVAAELKVAFKTDDPMCYNVIAEIPGTDLADEVVMVGAHLDSWHGGTGATDNGVGSAAAMEAIRIIHATGLRPRRTIRVALWTGEEEGIFGSSAYVRQHFTGQTSDDDEGPATKPPEFEKLSVYFNVDNGTGKLRGIYTQGNTAAAPIFKEWLRPLRDLGATTVTLANTGSTDHVPFDRAGLPGFQFIQDEIEYGTRTHHSNQDTYDRIQPSDMRQMSTVLATFAWKAANMDERFPRKPMPTTRPNE